MESSVDSQACEILHRETNSLSEAWVTEWEPWEIPPEEYRVEAKIGSGITAEVFRGTWRGTAVAIKQIKLNGRMNPKIVEAFKRELTVMVRCRHPNLVLFMGASTRVPPIRLLSEFCEGGTLFELLHNRKNVELSWRQRVKILLDVAKGLNYLHNCKPVIVHRDLKSLNLLLSEKIDDEFDTPIMKIADFGMAKIKANVESTAAQMTANAGTYHWMAPEVLGGNSYNEKVDIYSFGIVMFETLYREIPFEDTGLDGMKVAVAVSKGKRPNLEFVPKSCPIDLVALMQTCWDQNPEKRPTMEQVIEKLKSIRPSRPVPSMSPTPGMCVQK
jgi:serine/threonine protein kinase